MERIAICGCCVSRDTIAFAANPTIQTGCFIHFNSPLSLACENIIENRTIYEKDLINCSPFLKRVILSDWIKTSFDKLQSSGCKWCVIDIGHIRYDLGKITRHDDGKTMYITYSREATENIEKILVPALGSSYSFERNPILNLSDTELDSLIFGYCQKLTQIFEPENIILQEIRLCDLYQDTNGNIAVFDDEFYHVNEFILKCHNIIRKYIPQCRVIPFPQYVFSDADHIWGNYCLHYIHLYYQYAYECLVDIIEHNFSNEHIEKKASHYGEIFLQKLRNRMSQSYEKCKLVDNIYSDITQINSGNHVYGILEGGISGSSFFNRETKQLYIKGWYLPVDAYDRIVIEADGEYIGEARLGMERKDVESNYKYYKNSLHSGFELTAYMPLSSSVDKITLTAVKNLSIVKKQDYRIKNI